jgi:hypothetical protein
MTADDLPKLVGDPSSPSPCSDASQQIEESRISAPPFVTEQHDHKPVRPSQDGPSREQRNQETLKTGLAKQLDDRRRRHAEVQAKSYARRRDGVTMLFVPQSQILVIEALRQAGILVTEADEEDRSKLGLLFARLVTLPLTIELAAKILVRKGLLPATLADDHAEIVARLWEVIDEALGLTDESEHPQSRSATMPYRFEE